MAAVFITIFYNGVVEHTPSEGVVFTCDDTCLLKLKSPFTLKHFKSATVKKISPDGSKSVSQLIYRYPSTLAAGHKFYGYLELNSDDDVELMLDQFNASKHLGLSTVEVYADLVDATSTPSYDTQTQVIHKQTIPFSSNIPCSSQNPNRDFTPCEDFTSSTYHQFNPSSSQTHIPYIPPFSQNNLYDSIPSSSQNPLDLNTSYHSDNETESPYVSTFAGVHNEHVGDFSENEDDILQRPDADEQIAVNPHNVVQCHQPVPHFQNITTNSIESSDFEYGHSMDRNQQLVNQDPNKLEVGQMFTTKEMAINFIRIYHLNNSLNFKVDQSSKSRYIICCVHENCMWRCVVRLGAKSGLWSITQLTGPHTCTMASLSQDHRQLTASFMCENMLPLVKSDPTISVSVLIAHIRATYTYQTSYRKAWIAKQKAIERIYGNWEESYNQVTKWLSAFSYYVPDTKFDINYTPYFENGQQLYNKGVFQRIFWSFGPCIIGFKYCKPVISVDGTWLYGRYKGCLMLAIAQDGRSNCFPIAYAVVEGETADAWFFFLSHLRQWVAP